MVFSEERIMARKYGRVDKDQSQVVARLRALGCTVYSLASVGDGVPDLLVGIGGENHLIEVKSKTGVLTPDQVEFHAMWRGSIHVVRSVGEAQSWVMAVRARINKRKIERRA